MPQLLRSRQRNDVAAQITLPIVGVDYPNKKGPTRRFAVELLSPGDPVKLLQEPNNPADENAIAVYSADDIQVGYLPAQRAPYVGMRMSRGDVSAIFQGQTRHGAFVRIAFDGETPILPPEPAPEDAVADWWPDEEWPD